MNYLRIVIPAKNEEKHLPGLLDSIKKQSFEDFEIVVADADSTDNTKKIARKYGCKIVKGGKPDEGRNNGAKGCKSLLICFIDSDIVLDDPDFFKKALKEIERRKLDLAGTLQKPSAMGSKNFLYRRFYNFANRMMILNENTKSPLMQSVMFVKPEVHQNVGGFPPYEFGEDSAFAKMAVAKGYKFGVLQDSGKVFLSPRRLEKEGFFRSLVKYAFLNSMRLLGREFERGKSRIKYFKT